MAELNLEAPAPTEVAAVGPPQKKSRRTLQQKLTHEKEKPPLKVPCDCPRECISSINQRRRIEIYLEFWSISYNDRKNFIHHSVEQLTPRTVSPAAIRKRTVSYIYRFKDHKGEEKVTCKKFFLGTLGYNETSSVIATAKQAPGNILATPDGRGRKKLDFNPLHAAIDDHIKTYHPCISHYRREHAQNRLYLPHELTIAEMHKTYNQAHQDRKVDYTTYMRRVNNLNISFAKLGEEQCEVCAALELKPHETAADGQCVDNCIVCSDKKNHLDYAKEARDAYREDGVAVTAGRIIRSIDLQKVIMLPRLPGYKSACFTRRLVAFHHAYAPVGAYCQITKPISVVWNEAVSGRKCEDITSAVELALIKDRDADHIIYYMDNCSGQNKNYTLFTALIRIINGDAISANCLTLKFFEGGHTFMSADSFHASTERQIKRKENVYDFDDFVECIAIAGANVVLPGFGDFRKHEGQQSQLKLKKADRPKLSDIRVAEFRRGSRHIYYKKKHTDREYAVFDYLKAKCNLAEPTPNANSRGISVAKREGILKNLVPYMPASRRKFWQELPTAQVNDLIDNFE